MSSAVMINFFPTRGDFCHLLITTANSLDPDVARKNVWPDLDPNFRHSDDIPESFFEKVNFKKNPQMTKKKHAKLTSMLRVNA